MTNYAQISSVSNMSTPYISKKRVTQLRFLLISIVSTPYNSLKTEFAKIIEFEYLISTNCFLQGIKLKMIDEKRDILKQFEFEVSSLNINKIDLIKKFHER